MVQPSPADSCEYLSLFPNPVIYPSLFHIYSRWQESLKSLPFAVENELDWPQLSLVTGYTQSKWSVATGKMDSIYNRLVQRNRCNHRDYQNLAINGKWESHTTPNPSAGGSGNKATLY